jgi:hypothetical protein
VLNDWRAERLAWRAEPVWVSGGESRPRRAGWLARRAARILTEAGDRGDPAAIEAVWQRWLWHPDDARWELVCRWRPPQGVADRALAVVTWPGRPLAVRNPVAEFCVRHPPLADRVLAAVTDPGHAPQLRCFLGELCVRHGRLPGDPVRRVLVFAMSWQHEQRRAADPDGSLLAAAYRAADERIRDALRASLAIAGDLDLVRVVAESRLAELTTAEREYLTGRLAGREDWAGLWRLARDLPVVGAVDAVRRIGERWRPEGQRDRDLFCLLARHQPDAIRQARAALTSPVRVEVPGRVTVGALSADGRRVAVVTEGEGRDVVSVHELPNGALVRRYDTVGADSTALGYAGTTLVVAFSWRDREVTQLHRCPDGQGMEPPCGQDRAVTVGVGACRGGFVTASPGGRLTFRDSTGTPVRAWTGLSAPYRRWQAVLVSDPDSGRLVVSGGYHMMVIDARDAGNIRPVRDMHFIGERCEGACFAGPDHVVTIDARQIRTWSLDGPSDPVADRSRGRPDPSLPFARCSISAAAGGEVCVLDRSGMVTYFEGRTLSRVGEPRELTGSGGTVLFSSPTDTCHALGGYRFVEVVTAGQLALRLLADRPQASWRPADLAAMATSAPLAACRPAVRPLRDLLSDCLEHRFCGEIRLGAGTRPSGDDAIAIAISP